MIRHRGCELRALIHESVQPVRPCHPLQAGPHDPQQLTGLGRGALMMSERVQDLFQRRVWPSSV
jgi:hypothetical protein